MTEMGCAELASVDAEVALGTADARTRAAALAHAERCPACRRRLAALAQVSAGLVELAPPAQPPTGFESRVLARVPAGSAPGGVPDGAPGAAPAGPATARGAWTRRRWAAAAALVALALVVGAGGWWAGRSTGPQPGRAGRVATATLVGDHGTGGQVVLVPGADPWLSMSVRTTIGAAVLRCQVVEAGGRRVTIGSFRVLGGYGYWAAPLPPGATVRSVRVVDAGGTVLASASLGGTGG